MKSGTVSGRRCRLRRSHRLRMLLALTAGLLAAVPAGCVTDRNRVEYIPSDRAVVPLKKGEAAPAEGWFVPPAIMQEMIPCLDERFREEREDEVTG